MIREDQWVKLYRSEAAEQICEELRAIWADRFNLRMMDAARNRLEGIRLLLDAPPDLDKALNKVTRCIIADQGMITDAYAETVRCLGMCEIKLEDILTEGRDADRG